MEEINLSKLHTDVVFKRAGGQIIWQPRIGCWYTDKKFAGEVFPEPYEGMSIPEIYRSLGCSARLYEYFSNCYKKIEHPSVTRIEKRLNDTDVEFTIHTPVGRQVEVKRHSGTSWYAQNLKWEIETAEELKVAIWREENSTWEWDQGLFESLLNDVGDLGAPTIYLPRMNIQSLYIDKMGIEKGIMALYEQKNEIEAFFGALEENQDRLIDLLISSPVEIFNYGENIHSATITEEWFLKYHLPACQRRSDRFHLAGKFVSSHWDGDCSPLLKYAKETGLDGIEAITPKPQGDVTLEEVKLALGEDLFLLDGLPAIYFDKIFPEELLIETTNKVIELFAPNLVLGISDEISSTGDIERIRLVGKIVDEYNKNISCRKN